MVETKSQLRLDLNYVYFAYPLAELTNGGLF